MVFLGLGSNLGDRAANITAAVTLLDQWPGIKVSRWSSLYETEPFGYKEQPDFLNAVAAVETVLSPEELLSACLQIEQQLGRQRDVLWGPRIIDIDLLLFGTESRNSPELMLPHPYLAQRRFVLLPLAEICNTVVLGGKTPAQLLAECTDSGKVILYKKSE